MTPSLIWPRPVFCLPVSSSVLLVMRRMPKIGLIEIIDDGVMCVYMAT